MIKTVTSWILRIIAAGILLQTLYFKFTGAEASVELFSMLGMEPHGRILIGILELITAVMLLVPLSAAWGALLGTAIMCGALLGHVSKLGFQGEMFSLGMLAMVVLLCCLAVLLLHRDQVPFIRRMMETKEEVEDE